MRGAFWAAALTLLGSAVAHTAVTSVSPGEGKTVIAPKEVVLNFNEAVNLRFSTFKVYPLVVTGDALAVNRAASKLAARVLPLKNDLTARADLPVRNQGNTARVVLPLKTRLKAGAYVVMWRLLSDDGHPVTSQYVFKIK